MQPIIEEYIILSRNREVNLQDDVNNLIKVGWVPLGGLIISGYEAHQSSLGVIYAQAMVKYKEDTECRV